MSMPKRMADCHPDRPHKAHGLCEQCYGHKYHKENAEKRNAYSREWQRKNPEKYRERQKKNRKLYALRHTYGITLDDYTRLFDEQGGRCAICGRDLNECKACVDHDHSTQEIRGLLCSRCNNFLGWIEAYPELLQKAEDYVENANTGLLCTGNARFR